MGLPAQVTWPIHLYAFFVEESLMGQTMNLRQTGDIQVELQLPEASQDENRPKPDQVSQAELVAHLTSRKDVMPISPDRPAGDGWLDEARRLHTAALEAAESALIDFIELVAYRNHFPELTLMRGQESSTGKLFVGESKVPVDYGNHDFRARVLSPSPLTSEQAQDIAAQMTAGVQAPLAWRYIAEAHRELHLAGDVRHALITATTAMEVGIKEGLRNKAPSRLMDFMLRRGRLEDLLIDAFAVAFGETYAASDKTNYDFLVDLQRQRNDLLHHGASPQVDWRAIERKLEAVYELLHWIDQRMP